MADQVLSKERNANSTMGASPTLSYKNKKLTSGLPEIRSLAKKFMCDPDVYNLGNPEETNIGSSSLCYELSRTRKLRAAANNGEQKVRL